MEARHSSWQTRLRHRRPEVWDSDFSLLSLLVGPGKLEFCRSEWGLSRGFAGFLPVYWGPLFWGSKRDSGWVRVCSGWYPSVRVEVLWLMAVCGGSAVGASEHEHLDGFFGF